jgi:ArsR family transcriptional regulator, arsenate/arsenite/antimonite-responsive transcriptional repressor
VKSSLPLLFTRKFSHIDISAYADYIINCVLRNQQENTITISLTSEAPLQSDTEIHDIAQMYKALGDVTRLRILGLLHTGERCVCDIMEVLKLPQSTVSRHLAYLRNSGWIGGRRQGKWMYYQLRQTNLKKGLQKKIMASLAKLPTYKTDQRCLKEHLQAKEEQRCL